jgi:hypothetical protein
MITQAELKLLFDYVDGHLVSKTNSGNRKIGDTFFSVTEKGYIRGRVDGKNYKEHRLIFLYHHGFMPKQIDHIDGNPANNKIENLREATSKQNSHNRKAIGLSKIKGVYWSKQTKKWLASITVNRKNIYLGSFEKIEDAALVATQAREKIHGEFARKQA